MPQRYHIHVAPIAGRFRRVGKFGSVDWREDCSRCTNCVKPRCIYDVYKKESAHNRDAMAPVQLLCECKACLSCVQGCTKGLLQVSLNPEFMDMGDDYWRPDIIATTWNQADTGKIPVSGAGYRGRFHGFGFDSIWTDMSEIVRPTRDGIHGREYISTSVDIGLKPMRLAFSADGKLITPDASLVETPMPAILDVSPWETGSAAYGLARLAAAAKLQTLCVATPEEVAGAPAEQLAYLVPLLNSDVGVPPASAAGVSPASCTAANTAAVPPGKAEKRGQTPSSDNEKGVSPRFSASVEELIKKVRMVQIVDGPQAVAAAKRARETNPAVLVSVRLPLAAGTFDRITALSADGIKVFHLCADLHGREHDGQRRHIKDVLREVHGQLVKAGIRDEITLIISGGIALAEHMAKAVICGADLVAADTALLVALGCRVCRGAHADAQAEEHCPAGICHTQAAEATQRIVNLMGAWHSQLIEVLGAMGIREVRRLRGEVGRAIFMEDIEKEAFGDLVRK